MEEIQETATIYLELSRRLDNLKKLRFEFRNKFKAIFLWKFFIYIFKV